MNPRNYLVSVFCMWWILSAAYTNAAVLREGSLAELSKLVTKQATTTCVINYTLTSTADYPDSSNLQNVLEHSQAAPCVNQSGSPRYEYDLSSYMTAGQPNNVTVASFNASSRATGHISIVENGENDGEITVHATQSAYEESLIQAPRNISCMLRIAINYTLEYIVSPHGDHNHASGEPVVTVDPYIACFRDAPGHNVPPPENVMSAVMAYSGISSAAGFDIPSNALDVPGIDWKEMAEGVFSKVKQAVSEGLQKITATPTPYPNMVSCSMDYTMTSVASYPASSNLQTNLSHPEEQPCVNQSGSSSYMYNLEPYMTAAEQNNITVTGFNASSHVTGDIAVIMVSPVQGNVSVKVTQHAHEESHLEAPGDVHCTFHADINYTLDYLVWPHHDHAHASGEPVVTLNSSLDCLHVHERHAVTPPQDVVNAVLQYSGISSTAGFMMPSDMLALTWMNWTAMSMKTFSAVQQSVNASLTPEQSSNTASPDESATPTPGPVCVESIYIEMHGLEKVHEQDSYESVLCVVGSTLPCGTPDHLLEMEDKYISYEEYCVSHACSSKMAYVNGIKHSQASRLVHDGTLRLTTMTKRTNKVGLLLTGWLQRHGALLYILDRWQRREYLF